MLAFFQGLLNKRWFDNGLLTGRLSVEFVNPENDAAELLGADVRQLAREEAGHQGGSLPL